MRFFTHIAIFVSVAAISDSAIACSCGTDTFESLVTKAEIVAIADLVEAKVVSERAAQTGFRVVEIVKGPSAEMIRMDVNHELGDGCGLRLIVGWRYVLVIQPGRKTTSPCEGTRLFRHEDMPRLRRAVNRE